MTPDAESPVPTARTDVSITEARQRLDQLEDRRTRLVLHEALDLAWFNRTAAYETLGFDGWYRFLGHLYPASGGSRGSQLFKLGQVVQRAADELAVDAYTLDPGL